MIKKTLFYVTAIFFTLENTVYFIINNWGEWAMLVALLQVLFFFALLTLALYQMHLAITERPRKKQRTILVIFMALVLSVTYAFPNGIINYAAFEKEPLLVAQRGGTANCMTTLKLNPDFTFSEKNICFGMSETTGTYIVKNDTIFFDYLTRGRGQKTLSTFAIIKKKSTPDAKNLGTLVKYLDYKDTTGYALSIVKNEMK